MQIVLDMAISVNGMIAREDGNEDWLPEEGWADFVEQAIRFDNIVMGRETYDQVTQRYENYNFDNVGCAHKIIVTRNVAFSAPPTYTVVHSPEEAVAHIKTAGLGTLLLIGGGKLNAEFLKRKLVNQLQLTINPYILGEGRPFIASQEFEAPLKLINTEPLSKGRIQLTYQVA